MKERLSETRIRNTRLPPGTNELALADGDGLYLRVRRSRADPAATVRQWIFVYKTGGKVNKVGLGGYEEVSLTQARAKADTLRQRRDAGGTPTRDAANAALRTCDDLFRLHEQVRPAAAGRAELWERHCAGPLGRVRLEDLSRRHIVGLLDDIAIAGRRNVAAGGRWDMRRTAGAVFGLLKQITAFGVSRGVLASDPMTGMKRKDFGHQGVPRERILAVEELAELSRRAGEQLLVGPRGREFHVPALHPGTAAACWFLIATCARVGELAAMRMADLDLPGGTWTIPAAVAKNRKEHLVHLSPFALRMIGAMRRLPTRPPRPTSKPADTVFLGGDTLAKALHDRQRPPGAEKGTRRAVPSSLLLPGGPFTPHDLRRTGASLMQSLGVRPDVIEKCLNHTPPALVAVYQRDPMLAERRAAFAALGALLERTIDTSGIDRALARAER